MPITLQFALRVRDLHRRGLTAKRIAARLGTTLDDVMEAHRLLDLPMNDTDAPFNYRADAEREAERERMPLRIQKRINDARRH
jgi:hypothetical protein